MVHKNELKSTNVAIWFVIWSTVSRDRVALSLTCASFKHRVQRWMGWCHCCDFKMHALVSIQNAVINQCGFLCPICKCQLWFDFMKLTQCLFSDDSGPNYGKINLFNSKHAHTDREWANRHYCLCLLCEMKKNALIICTLAYCFFSCCFFFVYSAMWFCFMRLIFWQNDYVFKFATRFISNGFDSFLFFCFFFRKFTHLHKSLQFYSSLAKYLIFRKRKQSSYLFFL